MRHHLGIFLVLLYYAHCVMAMFYAATIIDPKGQAVWLSAPLWLTPPSLLQFMPLIGGEQSHERWVLQTLIYFPAGFAFTSISLYGVGAVLQRIWELGLYFAVAVGASLGFFLGWLWFAITHEQNLLWFSTPLISGLISALIFRHDAQRPRAD